MMSRLSEGIFTMAAFSVVLIIWLSRFKKSKIIKSDNASTTKFLRNHELPVFFIIAIGISAAVAFIIHNSLVPSILNIPLMLIGFFTPTIAALFLTGKIRGKKRGQKASKSMQTVACRPVLVYNPGIWSFTDSYHSNLP